MNVDKHTPASIQVTLEAELRTIQSTGVETSNEKILPVMNGILVDKKHIPSYQLIFDSDDTCSIRRVVAYLDGEKVVTILKKKRD